MPMASINTTTIAKPGFFARVRMLVRRSRTKFSIARFLRRYSYRNASRASTFIGWSERPHVRRRENWKECGLWGLRGDAQTAARWTASIELVPPLGRFMTAHAVENDDCRRS